MNKVLHITAHLGGGAGKAISGLVKCSEECSRDFKHTIIILEKPEKELFIDNCIREGIDVTVIEDLKEVIRHLSQADIVVLNWWHHPKIAELLLNFPSIPVRLILWSHINGCTYPFLPYEFSEEFNHVMFTCRYSFDNPLWDSRQKKWILDHTSLVYGMGEFTAEDFKYKCDYSIGRKFTVGYIGTLSYSKLNPDFIGACKEICKRIPSVEFVLVGELDQELLEDINACSIKNHFKITGYLEDVAEISLTFDVFGYPLNNFNFATTENSLLEAMARALPVVALKQGTEQYIIRDGETGFLASGIEHYADIVEYLYKRSDERERIGENARNHVIRNYSLLENIERYHEACSNVIKMEKKSFNFSSVIGNKPYEIFLSSLGTYKSWFLNSLELRLSKDTDKICELKKEASLLPQILKGKTKSSVEHFSTHFPEDEILQFWRKMLKY